MNTTQEEWNTGLVCIVYRYIITMQIQRANFSLCCQPHGGFFLPSASLNGSRAPFRHSLLQNKSHACHAHIYTHKYIYTQIHKYTNTQTHTYTNTHIHNFKPTKQSGQVRAEHIPAPDTKCTMWLGLSPEFKYSFRYSVV